jgi:hypothetical protein
MNACEEFMAKVKIMSKAKFTVLIILASCFIMWPNFLLAQEKTLTPEEKYGLDAATKGTELRELTFSNNEPENLIQTVINIALGFVATIFFLLVLYAAITWMTARGSSEKIDSAKKMIEAALIGLIIIAASYAISNFVFSRFATGGTNVCTKITGAICKEQCLDKESPVPAEDCVDKTPFCCVPIQ